MAQGAVRKEHELGFIRASRVIDILSKGQTVMGMAWSDLRRGSVKNAASSFLPDTFD